MSMMRYYPSIAIQCDTCEYYHWKVDKQTGKCFEWCQIKPFNVVPNQCSAWQPIREKVCEILNVYESKNFSKDETENKK